jgi:small GTP-binding protein
LIRLKPWQWAVLLAPPLMIVLFILIAAGQQIHQWGLSWLWAIFTVVFLVCQRLLVKWTKSELPSAENFLQEIKESLPAASDHSATVENILQDILSKSQNDPPIWESWGTFGQRCQELVRAIARIYHPEVKYPLLNVYVPQAYGLIRGTMGDLDRWMQKLSPVLNQMTVAQAYQTYETYRQIAPTTRKFWRAWGLAQWLLNPVAAIARTATQGYSNQASQELLMNFSQLVREITLKNLAQRAVYLYSQEKLPTEVFNINTPATLPQIKTQSIKDILNQSTLTASAIVAEPVNILLVGRTGAGKSSLINTLFQAELAQVDVLPSTEEITNYQWQSEQEQVNLWDTPGYEQIKGEKLRQLVLDYADQADLLLLVTPALDPSLQMDADFLTNIRQTVANLPVIVAVSQVDRLRPWKEWQPPYDWVWGERPKEVSIREATNYRIEQLAGCADLVLPVVTSDLSSGRQPWNIDTLSLALVSAIAPAKQQRLARYLRDIDSRAIAASKIIEQYSLQMATSQGLAALLKSPVLQFITTLSTGSPALAYLLAEKIPIEQLPVVIGKLQIAYDLYHLLAGVNQSEQKFDLLNLWPLLLENNDLRPEQNAEAWGHALVEYWTQNLTINQLRQRYDSYRQGKV